MFLKARAFLKYYLRLRDRDPGWISDRSYSPLDLIKAICLMAYYIQPEDDFESLTRRLFQLYVGKVRPEKLSGVKNKKGGVYEAMFGYGFPEESSLVSGLKKDFVIAVERLVEKATSEGETESIAQELYEEYFVFESPQ